MDDDDLSWMIMIILMLSKTAGEKAQVFGATFASLSVAMVDFFSEESDV